MIREDNGRLSQITHSEERSCLSHAKPTSRTPILSLKYAATEPSKQAPCLTSILHPNFPLLSPQCTHFQKCCVRTPLLHTQMKNQINFVLLYSPLTSPSFSHLPLSGPLSDKKALCNMEASMPWGTYPTCTWGLQCRAPCCRGV